ncbi:MAG: serine/threonine-protein kinase [Clostridia bacterium]|nr:serine/threonine-protein kinase [Clostridia bacterium]
MAADEKFPLALYEGSILAGRYIIKKVLGQGGFGITYCAVDHKTGQTVAIKEFFPDTLAYREGTTVISYPGDRTENYEYGKENFLQEAQTLAQFIGNDNIVRIHNYFEENGTAYFVMDYIEGISFDDYIKQKGGKISVEEAEKILIPIMDALGAVHEKGIVHRDVTPDNIYICNDGTVKLLDFGAARYSLGDKSRSLDVILKHGFAPKEQYTRHGKQGPYTDIYSLAATFYFAITGKRPPDSVDRMDVDDLVPPSSLGIDITDYQEEALFQAMSVQPYDRFQSMAVFKSVLLNEKNYAPQETVPEVQNVAPVPPVAPVTPVEPVTPVTTAFKTESYNETPQNIEPVIQNTDSQVYIPEQVNNTKKKTNKKILAIVLSVVAVIAVAAAVIIPMNLNNNKVPVSTNYSSENSTRKESSSSPGTFYFPSSIPSQTSQPESSVSYTRGTVNISSQISRNIVNGGIVTWDDNCDFFVSDNRHSIYRLDSNNKSTCVFNNTNQKYSNLYCADGGLYYLSNNTVCFWDYQSSQSNVVSALQSYNGKINAFYVTDDYYFIYYFTASDSGYVYRITKSTGNIEEQLPVKYWHNFLISGKWLYYITTDDQGRSAISSVLANDFSQKQDNSIYLNQQGLYYHSIVSDGNYIYVTYKNSKGTWNLDRFPMDLSFNNDNYEYWSLSDICQEGGLIQEVNTEGNIVFISVKNSDKTMSLYRLILRSDHTYKYRQIYSGNTNLFRPNVILYNDGVIELDCMKKDSDGNDVYIYKNFDSSGNILE